MPVNFSPISVYVARYGKSHSVNFKAETLFTVRVRGRLALIPHLLTDEQYGNKMQVGKISVRPHLMCTLYRGPERQVHFRLKIPDLEFSE